MHECHDTTPEPQGLGTARHYSPFPGLWANACVCQATAAVCRHRGLGKGHRLWVRQTQGPTAPLCAVTLNAPFVYPTGTLRVHLTYQGKWGTAKPSMHLACASGCYLSVWRLQISKFWLTSRPS